MSSNEHNHGSCDPRPTPKGPQSCAKCCPLCGWMGCFVYCHAGRSIWLFSAPAYNWLVYPAEKVWSSFVTLVFVCFHDQERGKAFTTVFIFLSKLQNVMCERKICVSAPLLKVRKGVFGLDWSRQYFFNLSLRLNCFHWGKRWDCVHISAISWILKMNIQNVVLPLTGSPGVIRWDGTTMENSDKGPRDEQRDDKQSDRQGSKSNTHVHKWQSTTPASVGEPSPQRIGHLYCRPIHWAAPQSLAGLWP